MQLDGRHAPGQARQAVAQSASRSRWTRSSDAPAVTRPRPGHADLALGPGRRYGSGPGLSRARPRVADGPLPAALRDEQRRLGRSGVGVDVLGGLGGIIVHFPRVS